jgi:hypothetical protein
VEPAVSVQVPAGWPDSVQPRGSGGFETTAVAWLLDVVPPDYRLHGVLRRSPVALAAVATHHIAACVQGAREGYRTTRTELRETLAPHTVNEVLAAYRSEGQRLVASRRADHPGPQPLNRLVPHGEAELITVSEMRGRYWLRTLFPGPHGSAT